MNRVLLTSIGRRGYLARYFIDAFGSDGVVVGDSDAFAPGMQAAHRAVVLPAFTDPGYVPALEQTIADHGISLVLSLHDGEGAVLAGARTRIESSGCTVLGVGTDRPTLGLDKLETYESLAAAGVDVPRTYATPKDALVAFEVDPPTFPLIAKPRAGSASIGVARIESASDLRALCDQPDDEQLLVQELVEGAEHGVDIVSDLHGHYLGVLARRKNRMVNGETDDAVTVDASPFDDLARRVAGVTAHRGLVDLDVIVSGTRRCVIDLNPRFGGGYPFSHAAGAHVPELFRRLMVGRNRSAPSDVSLCLRQAPGVRSRKTVEVVTVEGSSWLETS